MNLSHAQQLHLGLFVAILDIEVRNQWECAIVVIVELIREDRAEKFFLAYLETAIIAFAWLSNWDHLIQHFNFLDVEPNVEAENLAQSIVVLVCWIGTAAVAQMGWDLEAAAFLELWVDYIYCFKANERVSLDAQYIGLRPNRNQNDVIIHENNIA
jgi:hypothetical protein